MIQLSGERENSNGFVPQQEQFSTFSPRIYHANLSRAGPLDIMRRVPGDFFHGGEVVSFVVHPFAICVQRNQHQGQRTQFVSSSVVGGGGGVGVSVRQSLSTPPFRTVPTHGSDPGQAGVGVFSGRQENMGIDATTAAGKPLRQIPPTRVQIRSADSSAIPPFVSG